MQTDFEAQAQQLFTALDLPPDRLKEVAEHDFLLSSMAVDGRVGPGMRVLAGLPPGALTALLRGGLPISMPVSQLPPQSQKALEEARAWLAAEFARQGVPDEMIKKGTPVPTQISIYVSRDPEQVAPGLYIDTGMGSGDYFGGGYMELPWRQKMNADWMQPGEGADNPASARALAASRPPADAASRHVLADCLLRASDSAHVPLLARLPQSLDESTHGSAFSQVPLAKTVGAFLGGMQGPGFNLQHKWRGGVLLLTCQS